MSSKGERDKMAKQHIDAHQATMEVFVATDEALKEAQTVISRSRLRLEEAKRKYEERLYGFDPN